MELADPIRLISDEGLAIAGVVAFAVAIWWLIREYIRDLKATRDRALTGWEGATEALDRLADELRERRR